MFHLLAIFANFNVAKGLIKEKLEKPVPANQRFDYDAYWKDVEDGMSVAETNKKHERGEYYTTTQKPLNWWELPLDTIVDTARYENDKKIFSSDLLEKMRIRGEYRQIKRFGTHEELFGK